MDQAHRPPQRDRQPRRLAEALQGGDPGPPHQPRAPRRVALDDSGQRFGFVQFEFPWELGPDDGRYVVRDGPGDPPMHVVVLGTLGAPQRRLLGGRRARGVEPEPPPAPVPTARLTVIGAATPFDAQEAAAWLHGLSPEGQAEQLADGLAVANRMLHAHRLAAADPTVRDVARPLVARIGYGSGEQVADGRWEEALEVPLDRGRRARRAASLRPQERLAALLGGRDEALACEELTIRARSDLDAGRDREAALQLRVALEAGIAELERSGGMATDMRLRVEELGEHRKAVGETANAALAGPLPADAREAVAAALSRLEAALRARSAAGFDAG